MSFRYLFIGGCPRSGTTAITQLLNSGPEFVIGIERFKYIRKDVTPGHFLPDKFLNLCPEETNILSPARHSDFQERLQTSSAQYIGDKVPSYFDQIPYILNTFPGSKVLMMIRNPVRVASSFNTRAQRQGAGSWPESNDYRLAVKIWNQSMKNYLAIKNSPLRDKLFLVHYESFFSMKENNIEALFEFLQLPLTENFRAEYALCSEKWRRIKRKPLNLSSEEKQYVRDNVNYSLLDKLAPFFHPSFDINKDTYRKYLRSTAITSEHVLLNDSDKELYLIIENRIHQRDVDHLIKHVLTEFHNVTFIDFSDKYFSDNLTKYCNSNSISFKSIEARNQSGESLLAESITINKTKYSVVITSGICLSSDWLLRMSGAFETHPNLGAAIPLCNSSTEFYSELPPGSSQRSLDGVFRRFVEPQYPLANTSGTVCMMLRNDLVSDIRLPQSSQKTLSVIFKEPSTEVVTVDNLYVVDNSFPLHPSLVTSPKADERIRFLNAREPKFSKNRSYWRKINKKIMESKFSWSPLSNLRENYRSIRTKFRERDIAGFFRESVRSVVSIPGQKKAVPAKYASALLPVPHKPSVTYILHNLTVAGGVYSVIQLVNSLNQLGITARIAALYDYPEVYNWYFSTRPMIFSNVEQMIKNLPYSDVIVATHWTTAQWVKKLHDKNKTSRTAYFVQDFEPDFYQENSKEREAALKSYHLIETKLVKSGWLEELLADRGFESIKVPFGIDTSIFHPSNKQRDDKVTLLAMARPRTPRRGFGTICAAFEIVQKTLPHTNIVLFGDDLSKETLNFKFTDAGIITDMFQLADLYRDATIFVEGSDFQAFGRTTMEAMACGTPCVVTNSGGVNEYARHEENCLMVPPKDPETLAGAIIRLIKDKDLQRTLVANALQTANNYSPSREAEKTLEVFNKILD